MTNDIRTYLVAEIIQVLLTDNYPCLEQCWNIPGLNDRQVDPISVTREGAHE